MASLSILLNMSSSISRIEKENISKVWPLNGILLNIKLLTVWGKNEISAVQVAWIFDTDCCKLLHNLPLNIFKNDLISSHLKDNLHKETRLSLVFNPHQVSWCRLKHRPFFSWGDCKCQEKLKAMIMQSFGGTTKSIMVFFLKKIYCVVLCLVYLLHLKFESVLKYSFQ